MAKKKTKTKASSLAAEALAAVNASKELQSSDDILETNDKLNEGARVDRMRESDFLVVHLKSTVGKNSSLLLKPRVLLAKEDAILLKLRCEDYVILASLSDKSNDSSGSNYTDTVRRVNAVSVLPIDLYDENQTGSEIGASPAFHRKNLSHLPPGTIQFTSSLFMDMFDSEIKSLISQTKGDDEGCLVQPPTQTDSVSFSFKNVVQSPRSSNAQKRVSLSSKEGTHGRKRQMIHIISCKSILGQLILSNLSSQCSMVVVEHVVGPSQPNELNEVVSKDPTLSSHTLPTSVRVLERLIHAHIDGSYVQLGQVLRISFAGKPCHFRILDLLQWSDSKILATTSEAFDSLGYQLEDDFSSLTLRDYEKFFGGGLDSKDSQSLVASLLNCGVQLHYIGRSTQISIISEGRSSEKAVVVPSDSIESSIVHPISSKMYVAGLSSTLQEVRSLLLAPLTQPEFFTKRGMKAPRGALLHGPSGSGKTSLAKQMSNEISRENEKWNCDVRYMHCASLQSKSTIVGEAETILTRLFHPVEQKSILIILDDVHLICARRGSGSTGTDRLAATLLALMDGIQSTCDSVNGAKSSQPVLFILAITTNPSSLDPALRRPGRLDNEVEVPLPEDVCTRGDILQFHIKQFGVQVADNLIDQSSWSEVAKLAKGFNGADCMLAAKEAVRLAFTELPDSDFVVRQDHLKAAIRSIKPSAIKSIVVEIPEVLWSSIGGMDSVKRELREAIELPLTHGEYFQQLRIPPPRGILLYGPPGCSKTLMARALATEGNMNFLAVKGPELLSKWLGESERALSSLFRRARLASPAIVFFDEIDAIGASRGKGDSASSGRLLSQLLTELDGINHTGSAAAGIGKKLHRVVVVGATNRPDLLDTALTRPGRIDRMIYVGPPDAASRAQILQLSLQNTACGNDIDISSLASDACSAGFSGAEMVAICRDAALLALEEVYDGNLTQAANDECAVDAMPTIEMRHLLLAMQQMQRQITPEMVEFYKSYRENYDRRRQS